MARRKMPKRDSKGRFVKTTRARRNAPKRKTTTRKRTTTRRRTYAKNPKAPDVVTMLLDGSIAASQVLVGKAAARAIPEMANLPKQGNVGLAVQAAVALASGYVSSMFLSRGAAAAIMAGGLTAPIETLIVANNVPFLSDALAPQSAQAAVNGYTMGRYPQKQIGRYPQGPRPVAKLAGYPSGAMGSCDDDDYYGAY